MPKKSETNGSARAKNGANGSVPSDAVMSRKKKKLDKQTAPLQAKASTGDKAAAAALKRITATFEAFRTSKQVLHEKRNERTKDLGESNERFRVAMESTTDFQAPEDDRLEKLKKIERAWQDLEETKARTIEEVRDAKGDYRRLEKALEEAVVEGRQARLPFEEAVA